MARPPFRSRSAGREERLAARLAAVPATALGGLGFATFAWLSGVTAGL